jgi:phage gp46-like protein
LPDIRLVPVAGPIIGMDWLQQPITGLIDETAELISAVNVALMTDALAGPTDVLPDPNSTDRRGWWGDLEADTIWGGWPIGSKLWLLSRAKIVDSGSREGATIARVQAYISACIQPFVNAKLASRFSVTATQVSKQRIDARVIIYRGPKSAIELQYQALWDELPPSPPFPPPQTILSGAAVVFTGPPPGQLDFSQPAGSGFIPLLDD